MRSSGTLLCQFDYISPVEKGSTYMILELYGSSDMLS